MASHRKKAIIAVFGGTSDSAIALAPLFGKAIAEQDQILLTGGSGPGSGAVKSAAITGVGSGLWIGVDRPKNRPEKSTSRPSKDGKGFIISSHLHHKRNYVEAALCDAAVGLASTPGTYSEVIFALSLHRHVALVEESWKTQWPLVTDSEANSPSKAASRAMATVGTVPCTFPKLRALLNTDAVCSAIEKLPSDRYSYFDPLDPNTPHEVIKWILAGLESDEGMRLHGAMPQIEGHGDIEKPYAEWLEKNST